MSVEHKVLGFRPPHDSLAAAAQAAAARHPEGEVVEADSAAAGIFDGSAVSAATNGNGNGKTRRLSIDAQKLREAAREDAQRILYVHIPLLYLTCAEFVHPSLILTNLRFTTGLSARSGLHRPSPPLIWLYPPPQRALRLRQNPRLPQTK